MAKKSIFESLLVGAAKAIDKGVKEAQKERERQRKIEERESLKREKMRLKELDKLNKQTAKRNTTIDISNK